MVIPNHEKTPAASYIMEPPLDFWNTSIIVDCLISSLLKDQTRCQIKWDNKNGVHFWERKINNAFWITWKHRTTSPTFTVWHSECSRGTDRCRTAFFTLSHSSSSAPNPTNLTRTSFNKWQNSSNYFGSKMCIRNWLLSIHYSL